MSFLPAALGGSPRRTTVAKKLSPKRKTMPRPISPTRRSAMSPTNPTKPSSLRVLVMGPGKRYSSSSFKRYSEMLSGSGLSYEFRVSDTENVYISFHKHDSDAYVTHMRNNAIQANTFDFAIVFADSQKEALTTLKTIRENTKHRTPKLRVMLVIDRIAIDTANIASYSAHEQASSFLFNFSSYIPVTKDNEDLIPTAIEEFLLQLAKSANVQRHRVK